MGEKVSFRLKDFDIIIGLKYRSRCEVQFEHYKALQLRKLYLEDTTSMNEFRFVKDYPNLQFENDKEAVKISVFNFIKFAMIGRKRRQHMDFTLLSLIEN